MSTPADEPWAPGDSSTGDSSTGDGPVVVGRLAPSPTGALHLGHARSFLLAWWSARGRGGRVVLRMEDLDRERVKPGMDAAVLEDLEWLGLDWDGPVVRQSERGELYRAALERLDGAGLVYACVCTRSEIELAASAPHAGDGTRRYPGTCRGRFDSAAEAEAATGRGAALRLAVPAGEIAIVDGLHGRVREDVAAVVGDFPLTRRDGLPGYQLAVVVDDAEQGVTEVVRGDDLLPSTARQALLQDLLGLPHPAWFHVSLVTDEGGRRLAKRSDDLSLAHLRERGVDPRRIASWAARSAGIEPSGPVAPVDLVGRVGRVGLARIPREPVAVTAATFAALGIPAAPPGR